MNVKNTLKSEAVTTHFERPSVKTPHSKCVFPLISNCHYKDNNKSRLISIGFSSTIKIVTETIEIQQDSKIASSLNV